MLESLSIKNFRNFRTLQIESLARINLVVGKNSVGKSNLLDAISLYIKQGDAKYLFELLVQNKECRKVAENRYVCRESPLDTLMSLFYGRTPTSVTFGDNDQIDISATPSNWFHKLTISLLFCAVDRSKVKPGWTTFESFSLDTQKYEVNAIIPDNSTTEDYQNSRLLLSVESGDINWTMDATESPNFLHFPFSRSQGNPPLHYIRTQFAQNRNNAEFWDEINLTAKEELAINALRILLPDIDRLSYKSDKQGERIPYVKLRNQDAPTPLYSLGEGVGRILTLILHLVNAENGTLLIDELENGLHYTIQEPLWQMIFTVAQQLNVQIFATTHSDDCLRAFAEVLKENGHSDQGRVLRLAKVKDDILCSTYGSRDLEEVFDKEMEVR